MFDVLETVMRKEDVALLTLLRISIGKGEGYVIPDGVDWDVVLESAQQHSVVSLAWDGLCKAGIAIDGRLRLKWLGMDALQETGYSRHVSAIENLSQFYRAQGCAMMVLKGYGLSLYYPTPRLRAVGDLDIFLLKSSGEWDKTLYRDADKALGRQTGIVVDDSHHHHSVFVFQGVSVENHYDFINVHTQRSARNTEKCLKNLAMEGYHEHVVGNSQILLPSADFNAVFLLRHNMAHFTAVGMSLRQLFDWLLFLDKYGKDVHWERILSLFDRLNMTRMCGVLNSIGVRYFGFDPAVFPVLESDDALTDRVFEDIVRPGFREHEDGSFLSAMWVKPRRWWSNRWKHRLCYKDSLLSIFLWGVWAKVLKPYHFKH